MVGGVYPRGRNKRVSAVRKGRLINTTWIPQKGDLVTRRSGLVALKAVYCDQHKGMHTRRKMPVRA